MGQVSVTLNDRTYRLVCGDGEEDRLVELAGYVKSKVQQIRAEVGHAGDERLMLMAALMIADELWDALAKVEAAAGSSQPAPAEIAPLAEPEPVRRLRTLAAKLGAERDGGSSKPTDEPAVAAAQPPAMTVANAKPRRRDVA